MDTIQLPAAAEPSNCTLLVWIENNQKVTTSSIV